MPLPPLYQTPGTNFHDVNLDWIINQVKNCIAEWTATKAEWTATQEAWTELQQYVQDYFTNLDVDAAISAKIDEMAVDGSLLALIRDTVNMTTVSATQDWLEANVHPETGYVLDDSLTVPLAAAGAEATGKAIANVTSYSVITYQAMVGRFFQNHWYDTSAGRAVVFPVEADKTYTITAHLGNRFAAYGFASYPVGDATIIGTKIDFWETNPTTAYEDLSVTYENTPGYAYIGIEVAYSATDPFPYPNVNVTVENREQGEPLTVNGIRVLTPEDIPVDWFKGKYVSILGDSISAWYQDIPGGTDNAYYKGSNAGVTSGDQMWYRILAANLGMNLLVNNSWSGSRVCKPSSSAQTATPASYPERCQQLHTEEHDPDVVLIAMGVNDWSYGSPTDPWDRSATIADDVSFEQSYIAMISRIHYSYPAARIFCFGPWYSQRETMVTVTKEVDGVSQTVPCTFVYDYNPHPTRGDYAEIIKRVCTMCDATFIDGNVGFNPANFYNADTPADGYCQDGSSENHYTHPNAKGHALMAKVLTDRLRLNL